MQAEEEAEDTGDYEFEDTGEPTDEPKDIELQTSDKTKKDKKTIIRAIRRVDSLNGILKDAGFHYSEVNDFLTMPTWPKHFVLVPGSRYLVTTYKEKPRVEVIFFIPRSLQVLQLAKDNENTELRLTDINLDVRVKQINGEVQGSLFGSIRKVASDPWIAMRFLDAYSLDYKLDRQVKRGAKFSIMYEEKVINGQFVAPGEVLYTSIEVDGRKEERHFLRANEGGMFLSVNSDHDIRPFYSPIEYLHISSPFNPRRFHPVKRRYRPHRGTDFALAHGSSVLAALEGVVTKVGRNRASGYYVKVAHKNGYTTEYVHLSEIEKKIRLGSKVSSGEKLGKVGCTGYCTRPHLHFGLQKNGMHVDPVRYVKPYTARQEPKVREFTECFAGSEKRGPAQNCIKSHN